MLRQDSRYYTLGHGGIFKRGVYAASRAFITRTDSGKETFNASEIFGAGVAASVPDLDKDWTALADQRTARSWHLRREGVLAGCQPRDLS